MDTNETAVILEIIVNEQPKHNRERLESVAGDVLVGEYAQTMHNPFNDLEMLSERIVDAVLLEPIGDAHTATTDLRQDEAETEWGRAITEHLKRIGGCREEMGSDKNCRDKCWEPADFVLWGKLLPPEALGPRCAQHAYKHIKWHIEQSAVVDLRPLRQLALLKEEALNA